MIQASDISFIIQGPIVKYTSKSIASIKKYFPKSKIIISCWEKDQTKNLNADIIIKNKDPGGLDAKTKGGLVNILRQKKTTLQGLRNSKTLYSVKIRSDMIFTGNNLIKEYYNIQNLQRRKIFYSQRILILENGSINPRGFYELPFHFGDWFYFGLTTDLIKMFDFKFSKKDEILNAFFYKYNKYPKNNYTKKYLLKFQPETIFTYFPIKKISFAYLNDSYDIRKKNISLSEFFLINDFKISSENKIQLKNLKHSKLSVMTKSVRYSEEDWHLLLKSFYSKNSIYFKYFFYIKIFLKKKYSHLIFFLKKLK